MGRGLRKDNESVGIMGFLCLFWDDYLDSHSQDRDMSSSCSASGLGSSYLSKKRDRERVGPTVGRRSGDSLSWDRGCMSLPKDILPKRSSSAPGSLVLDEGFLEHLLALDPFIFNI